MHAERAPLTPDAYTAHALAMLIARLEKGWTTPERWARQLYLPHVVTAALDSGRVIREDTMLRLAPGNCRPLKKEKV